MKTKLTLLCRALLWLALLSTLNLRLSTSFAQGTAFTYQGQLYDGANLATGSYDLTFALFTDSNGVNQVSGTITNSGTAVNNGLFTVTLDFGPGIFNGTNLWLQIGAETNGGGGSFTLLTPLQQLTPSPYAIYAATAGTASNAVTASTASTAASATLANSVSTAAVTGPGIAPGQVVKSLNSLHDDLTLAPGANISLATNGSTLTISATSTILSGSSNAWSLFGNAGTSPGAGNFIGTTDNQPLELRVNSQRLLRLEPATGNIIGGTGSTASGQYATVGGGDSDTAGDYAATVGGGEQNIASSGYATVGGGFSDLASGYGATVGGGFINIASTNFATVGGGDVNKASAVYATVSGGYLNTASGPGAFVGGGGSDGANLGANTASGPASTVSGGFGNQATNIEATVGGGNGNHAYGAGSFVGGGGSDGFNFAGNTANGPASTVGGGMGNIASAYQSTISGGGGNLIQATVADGSTIGGGGANQISTNSTYSTIGGGAYNIVMPYAQESTIAGGDNNIAQGAFSTVAGGLDSQATGVGSFIGGGGAVGYAIGFGNTASGGASAVCGGFHNKATGTGSFVGGGGTVDINNQDLGNTASGAASTVPGGYANTAAGIGSFAAGGNASALNNHSFVWGDGSRGALDQGINTFTILATGGVYFYTTTSGTDVALDNSGNLDFGTTVRQMLNLWGNNYAIGVQNNDEYFRSGSDFYWYLNGSFNSSQGSAGGGTTLMHLTSGGNLIVSGTVTQNSDRNVKANIVPVNPQTVLEKLAAIPMMKWTYKTEDPAIRHLGPMAQDFYAAFNLGEDEKHITTVDEGGVALAAIQGLNEKVEVRSQKSEDRIQKLEAENAELKARLEKLEQLINSKNGGGQ